MVEPRRGIVNLVNSRYAIAVAPDKPRNTLAGTGNAPRDPNAAAVVGFACDVSW